MAARPTYPPHYFPHLLHLLFHCAWVVLDGAPLLLAVVVAEAAGAPVWPVVGAVAGLPPGAADAAADVAVAAGCTINSFSI